MKTLADMTVQERKECVGMWAETTNGLAIIIEPFYTDGSLDTAVVFSLKPKVEILQCIAVYVTPRFDLPRAWNQDGTPPAGEWEYAEYLGDYKGMTNVYHFDGDPTHRRWVGEWEEA